MTRSVEAYTTSTGAPRFKVRYRLGDRARSETFTTNRAAVEFVKLLDTFGPAEAVRILNERRGATHGTLRTLRMGTEMETQTMTLTDFLLTRIAEDEASARAVSGERAWATRRNEPLAPDGVGRWMVTSRLEEYGYPVETIAEMLFEFPYGGEQRTASHIARHDPARVLAECEAKRSIVERYVEDVTRPRHPRGDYTVTDALLADRELTLRLLALPYSDHPDYDEAWRP